MDNYSVVIKNSDKKDFKKLKQSNLKRQFQSVIEILKQNPYYPNQSFEKLQPKHLGFYSRRLNQQHRIVYKINEIDRRVEIYSAWSRYE